MDFKDIINTMTYLSLGFISVEIYLSLNKLWKRKHEKMVAESISIGAKLISLTPALIFTIDFALSDKWASFMSYLLFLFSVLVHIAVGAGIWVVGRKKTGFWKLFGQSLKQESKAIFVRHLEGVGQIHSYSIRNFEIPSPFLPKKLPNRFTNFLYL